MAYQVDCPSCGASVRVRRGEVSAVCNYCGNSVFLPSESHGRPSAAPSSPPSAQGCNPRVLLAVIIALLLAVGGAAVAIFMAAGEVQSSVKTAVSTVVSGGTSPDLVFGGPGSGRGYFQDPQCIAADGHGRIYVGEWESGRVQVFDDTGGFLYQWSYAEPGEFYLSGMSASYDGTLYLVYDSELYVHDGETGQRLGNLFHPDGWGFEDVDVSPDDDVLAAWYCNRDDVLLFDPQGDMELLVEEAVSGVTGDGELSMTVAAGNMGEIYVFGAFNSAVVVYDAGGKFTDRFGDDQMFTMPFGMDVDPGGRLWISDFGDLLVFSTSGELLLRIETDISIEDFVIDDENRLWGITYDDEIAMIDISDY